MCDGELFQIIGAATENHRVPVLVSDGETSKSPWSDDRMVRVGTCATRYGDRLASDAGSSLTCVAYVTAGIGF